MKIKTSELKFGALDWCIAQIEGLHVDLTPPNYGDGTSLVFIAGRDDLYRPSTDWSQGGPLIEKYFIVSERMCDGLWQCEGVFKCALDSHSMLGEGETPLIAFCRAIVSAKLGDEVDVPEGLV